MGSVEKHQLTVYGPGTNRTAVPGNFMVALSYMLSPSSKIGVGSMPDEMRLKACNTQRLVEGSWRVVTGVVGFKRSVNGTLILLSGGGGEVDKIGLIVKFCDMSKLGELPNAAAEIVKTVLPAAVETRSCSHTGVHGMVYIHYLRLRQSTNVMWYTWQGCGQWLQLPYMHQAPLTCMAATRNPSMVPVCL